MGGAFHVFLDVLDMLFINVSNEKHAINHCILYLRSVLYRIFSCIGEWSELRVRFVFVVDVNWSWMVYRM